MTTIPTRALDELVELAAPRRQAPTFGDAILLEDLAKTYPDGTEAVRGISLGAVR